MLRWLFASGVLVERAHAVAVWHGDCMMNSAGNAEWLVMVAAVKERKRGVSDVVGGHLKVVDG